MPTGYRADEGKTYSKKLGRWLKAEKEKAFEYENVNRDSAALLISFFRHYPDYLCDILRSPNAQYALQLPQRMMLRIITRYKDTYITGCRGLTKTYCILLGKMIKGILYPGVVMRYCAPNQKQAAQLATQAFHQIEKDYPILASYWNVRNDRADMFYITTNYGSEFSMYAPRGSNCSDTTAEEIGAEGKDAFDMDKYEADVLPTCRIIRTVNQHKDRTYINCQHSHISNACSKVNRAYSIHRNQVMKEMVYGDVGDGYVIDFSYITALMGGLRDINYVKDMKSKLSPLDWLREMCARYTGTGDNPLIPDETIAKSKRNMIAEYEHCGDMNAIYIVSHDVSYTEGSRRAECADVVIKLTRYKEVSRRDKFRKQLVFADSYPPPKTAFEQAQKLKKLWMRYCLDGAQTTYLVIDVQAYGTEIAEELFKPTTDGTPSLCCVDHMRFADIEQPNALPVIYPMKAGTRGSTDVEGDMIQYAQAEFDHGYVELLTGNVLDGINAYKNLHDIKDDFADRKIKLAYDKSEKLAQQIANLKAEVSGLSLKERRKSKAIQRDIWSALKYALRMAQRLEMGEKKEKYRAKSSWSSAIDAYNSQHRNSTSRKTTVSTLLSNRKR